MIRGKRRHMIKCQTIGWLRELVDICAIAQARVFEIAEMGVKYICENITRFFA